MAGCDIGTGRAFLAENLVVPPGLLEGDVRLYDVMEELGDGPLTLHQIVTQCEYRRHGSLSNQNHQSSIPWDAESARSVARAERRCRAPGSRFFQHTFATDPVQQRLFQVEIQRLATWLNPKRDGHCLAYRPAGNLQQSV
jgi:hypothetical protein